MRYTADIMKDVLHSLNHTLSIPSFIQLAEPCVAVRECHYNEIAVPLDAFLIKNTFPHIHLRFSGQMPERCVLLLYMINLGADSAVQTGNRAVACFHVRIHFLQTIIDSLCRMALFIVSALILNQPFPDGWEHTGR